MSLSIKSIQKPFAVELKEYDRVFKEIMSSNVTLIDTVVKYIVKHKGKNLRPLLVLMSGKLTGTPNNNTYIVASIVEMLHSATLIHDDVVDDADLRRGFPSINAAWKNKIAVLIGDYLLSKCLIGGTKTGSLDVMNILADSSKRLSKGELLQIAKSKTLNITEDEFIGMISDKTAALIGAASELGAITSSDNEQDRENMKQFGESLGIAFQIHDDLLDYYGNQKLVGKPIGNDFKDKKLTLPLIYAFQKAEKKETSKIKKKIKKGVKRKEIKEIISFAEKYDGISYAQKMQDKYAQKAKDSLETYPDSDVKNALFKFVDYVIERSM
ncbi:MAG: polyprenyl synthetase family protein [Calditrichaeota bacterium]|nr:MAG: polyprenyl synthetase family protein [Calditrichota bacterium]MBL1205474.1 polyprenyl synthetase family protein [Calditrichota bacterium]NOG45303.1 polyprenyl synthetase family protein [Calditrichota bacterium]